MASTALGQKFEDLLIAQDEKLQEIARAVGLNTTYRPVWQDAKTLELIAELDALAGREQTYASWNQPESSNPSFNTVNVVNEIYGTLDIGAGGVLPLAVNNYNGDYSGVRISYPVYTDVDGNTWAVFGMDGGTVQFGLSSSNGKMYAGAGAVILDNSGITIQADNSTPWLTFKDENGDTIATLFQDGSGNLQLDLADDTKAFAINDGNVIINHATDTDSRLGYFENGSERASVWWDADLNNFSVENVEGGGLYLVLADLTSDTLYIWDRNTDTAYARFDADGWTLLQGTVTVPAYERHVQMAAEPSGTPANQMSAVTFGTAVGLQASSAVNQYAGIQWEVPDDWAGDDVIIEIDWMPDSGATSGTDAVRWIIEYRSIAAPGETITNGTLVTLDNGTGGDTGDYAQYQTVHTQFTLAYDNSDQPLTKEDHVYFLVHRDTAVANDFAGTVTVTAFEVVYNSVTFPTSN